MIKSIKRLLTRRQSTPTPTVNTATIEVPLPQPLRFTSGDEIRQYLNERTLDGSIRSGVSFMTKTYGHFGHIFITSETVAKKRRYTIGWIHPYTGVVDHLSEVHQYATLADARRRAKYWDETEEVAE